MAGNYESKMKEIKENFNKEFEMTDLGEPKTFLGIDIKRDKERKIITLSQTEYIDTLEKI